MFEIDKNCNLLFFSNFRIISDLAVAFLCSIDYSLLCKLYFEYWKAQENFEAETNKKFDLKLFRKGSIGKVYDSLHGISNDAVPLSNAVEIMAYCLLDGKVEQESEFETNLYNELVEQLREMKAGLKLTGKLILNILHD